MFYFKELPFEINEIIYSIRKENFKVRIKELEEKLELIYEPVRIIFNILFKDGYTEYRNIPYVGKEYKSLYFYYKYYNIAKTTESLYKVNGQVLSELEYLLL